MLLPGTLDGIMDVEQEARGLAAFRTPLKETVSHLLGRSFCDVWP